ncbi:MAG TPA: PqqD family protein [Thermoanaerobaculia bacterium]|nr:PqqD family protein [Thermoanaerobaculia bacterium]
MSHNLRPHPDVVARQLGDAIVLVQLTSSEIYELNRTGSLLWSGIAAGKSIDAIRAEILASYDVDEAMLDGEIAPLIRQLLDAELLLDDDQL